MKKHPSLIFIFLFAAISIYAIGGADPLINVKNYPMEYCFKQIQWYVISLIAIYCISKFSNQSIYRMATPFYIISLVAVWLLAFQHQFGGEKTMIPFSQTINGATAWYHIPGIGTIQPSEFLKIAYLLVCAKAISLHQVKYTTHTFKTDFLLICKIILITLPACLGIILQNDTGVMMILLAGTLFILFASGIQMRWFIIGGALILVTSLISFKYINDYLVNTNVEDLSYRFTRILGWLDPEKYYQSFGYQLYNANLTIGTAGIFGHGFQSIVMAFPEPQTDFIFAVAISNAGLSLGIFIILLIASFDFYLLQLSKKTDLFEHCVLVGLVGLLLFQQFWNIGMVLGILPITGITLPFISYGGSSLLSYMLVMGLVFNMEKKLAANPQKSSTHE